MALALDDPDVIAYLFPVHSLRRNKAKDVILENKIHLIHLRGSRIDIHPQPQDHGLDRAVRSATESPEEKETDIFSSDDACLEFRFSKPPKTSKGLVAGRCPSSDIVIPNVKGSSWYHFALTFDHDNRFIVRDLGSTVGTRMLYGSLSEDAKRGFNVDFSAEGPPLLHSRPPIIKITSELHFVLVMPRHDITSSTYLAGVARFREGTADAANLFSDMALQSHVRTELPTPSSEEPLADARVPGQIMWTQELGRGSFAVVCYAWDVQSRDEYALKKPLPRTSFSVEQWRREAEILKGLHHRNIVHLRHSIVSDDDNSIVEPELYFEYVPKGCLANYAKKATTFHMEQATFQILSALEYLHGQEPEPIVHRDIKPENILVQDWSKDRVQVKLSDFGLSNQGNLLKTFCGTLWYLAPEGYTKQTKRKYGPLVDIWAVGVLVFCLMGGAMPEYLETYQTDSMTWGLAVVESARGLLVTYPDSELLDLAIRYMLVPDHKYRRNASECRRRAQELKNVVEAKSLPIQGEGLAESDSLTCSEESDPNTPRAQTKNPSLEDENASTIRNLVHSLGERDDDAIDSIIGMAPSCISSFERLHADPPEAECGTGVPIPVPALAPAGSATPLLEGSLWNGPAAYGEVVEAVREDQGENDVLPEPHGENGGQPSYTARLNLLRGVGDRGDFTEAQPASQYKRRLWDENDEEDEVDGDGHAAYEVDKSAVSSQTDVQGTHKKTRLA